MRQKDRDIIETEVNDEGVFEPVKSNVPVKSKQDQDQKAFLLKKNKPIIKSVIMTETSEFLEGFSVGMGLLKNVKRFMDGF